MMSEPINNDKTAPAIASPIEIAKAVQQTVEILNSNSETFKQHGVNWISTSTSVIVNLKNQSLISINLGAGKKRVHSDVAAHLGKPADFEFDTFEEAQVRFFQELPIALQDLQQAVGTYIDKRLGLAPRQLIAARR